MTFARPIAAMAALMFGLAYADGFRLLPNRFDDPSMRSRPAVPPALTLFQAPFTSSGPFIVPDAAAVMHCRGEDFAANALTCSLGGAWTTAGTVPAQTVSGLYPSGFSGAARKAMGVFSDANYLSLGAGSDSLDLAGDFTALFVFRPSETAAINTLYSNTNGTNAGIRVHHKAIGSGALGTAVVTFGATELETANGVRLNAVNYLCVGRSGTTGVIKLNGSGIAVTGTVVTAAATSSIAYLGRNSSAGTPALTHLYEAYFTGTAATGASCATLIGKSLGHVGANGETITYSRGAMGQIDIGANVINYGTTSLRTNSDGALFELARTNANIRSESLDDVAYTATNVTVTANNAQSPELGTFTTAETLQATVNGGLVEGTAIVASASRYAFTFYARATSGTQDFAMAVRDSTAGADLSSCNKTATTTWARFECISVGAATASNNLKARVFPGGLAGTGTIEAWGLQIEAGAYSTSYIKTEGTAVARVMDLAVATAPITIGTAPSIAATVKMTGSGTDMLLVQTHNTGTDTRFQMYVRGSDNKVRCDGGDAPGVTSSNVMSLNVSTRVSCAYTGTQYRVCFDGTCTTSTDTGPVVSTYAFVNIGNHLGGSLASMSGYIKNVCVGRTSEACQ